MRKERQPTREKPRRGSIVPLPSGSFRAQVMLDGQRAGATFPTWDQAAAWLAGLDEKNRKYGISLDKTRVTVKQLTEMFLAAKEAANTKRSTLQTYEHATELFASAWPEMPAQMLTREHVEGLMGKLARGQGVTRALAPKTRKNVLTTLKGLLSYGVESEILDRNVAERVKVRDTTKPEPKFWTPEHVAKFQSAVEKDRLRAMWLLFLWTGLRVGEMCGLTWDKVNLDTGLIRIDRRLMRLKTGIDIDTPKSKQGFRYVRAHPALLNDIKAWKDRQAGERELAGDRWRGTNYVFTTWKGNISGEHRIGNHLEPRWVQRRLAKIIDDNDLPKISPHGLRHTFFTTHLDAHANPKNVQVAGGHGTLAMTQELYWEKASQAAAEELAVLSGSIYEQITHGAHNGAAGYTRIAHDAPQERSGEEDQTEI